METGCALKCLEWLLKSALQSPWFGLLIMNPLKHSKRKWFSAESSCPHFSKQQEMRYSPDLWTPLSHVQFVADKHTLSGWSPTSVWTLKMFSFPMQFRKKSLLWSTKKFRWVQMFTCAAFTSSSLPESRLNDVILQLLSSYGLIILWCACLIFLLWFATSQIVF